MSGTSDEERGEEYLPPRSRAERGRGTAVRERPVRRPVGPPTRRRALLRRWVALLVLLGLVVITVTVLFTPVLGVRTVDVSGTQALSPDQVRLAAEVPLGTPLIRLDTDAIKTRVSVLSRVGSVDVVRVWPSTIVIEVTEREPVATFNGPGGVHLVDATGDDYATVATAPPGLPTITVPHIAPNDPATQAAFAVLAVVPAPLRPALVNVAAQTPGSVTFSLNTGKTVIWGDAGNAGQKGAVLAALLSQPGKIYDVSAPDLPTISK
ncbi:MAG TPA: FtsQ-type POTRA domain-containing protein [Pseudonocardiaceae bacterium]|jgi:cell division protein FtsQ